MKNEKRNASIEALRCLLMFLIVAHHAFHWGIYRESTALWTNLFEGLIVWHVDAFIGISGWFGMRFALSKVLRLVGIMAWYSAMSVAYLVYTGGFTLKGLRIQGGWFGETYLFFLCIVPFVNAAIEKLVGESKRRVMALWLVIVIGYVFAWLPGHGFLPFAPSGVGPFSLFLFFFIYTTVRLIRMCRFEEQFARIRVAFIAFLLMWMACGGAVIAYRAWKGMPLHGHDCSAFTWYDAPHVWLFAVSLVVYFAAKVRLPARLERIVLLISPSMFGVYLLHETTIFGRHINITIEKTLESMFSVHPVVIILVSALLCFALCLAADLIRRWIVCVFDGSLKRLYGCVDGRFDLAEPPRNMA